jgi:2-polyprenyl-3-methyl-5-hydroxy-6-metoxy-1,4-benzoquinol methylase
MHYDPIKRSLGNAFNRSPFLRKFFYRLLDLLLLRTWHVHKELGAWSREFEDKKANILDAGAGFGQYTYWLSEKNKNWDILAVDVKEEQVRDCNNFFSKTGRTNVRFEVADLTAFVCENSFDLVLSVDVMEHIAEDELVFRNLCASMKKGGMLLISTPSDQGGSDVREKGKSSFIEEHVREGYGIKEIERKLHGAGFSKVETKYSYGTPGKISWRLSMKWPILMLGAGRIFFLVLPFYYLLAYPFAFMLNWLDTVLKHKTGTGLIVKAWK